MENLASLLNEALGLVAQAQNLNDLEKVRVDFLGKKGAMTALLKTLGSLSAEERLKLTNHTTNDDQETTYSTFPCADVCVCSATTHSKCPRTNNRC